MKEEIEFVHRSSATLVKTNATDNDVAMAAWVSFDQDKAERLEDQAGVQKLINFLLNNKHMSPFEHGSWTFRLDTPIFVAREFMRHRTMSYNEVSGRYTEMKPRFYVPPTGRPLVQQGKAGAYSFADGTQEQEARTSYNIRNSTRVAWDAYQEMIHQGIAKEVARMCLPVNMMTQFYATVNTRNLMHFLELRSSPVALQEIRQVAFDMEYIFVRNTPMIHSAWANGPAMKGM